MPLGFKLFPLYVGCYAPKHWILAVFIPHCSLQTPESRRGWFHFTTQSTPSSVSSNGLEAVRHSTDWNSLEHRSKQQPVLHQHPPGPRRFRRGRLRVPLALCQLAEDGAHSLRIRKWAFCRRLYWSNRSQTGARVWRGDVRWRAPTSSPRRIRSFGLWVVQAILLSCSLTSGLIRLECATMWPSVQ